MENEIIKCQLCDKRCNVLHNCTEAPHDVFDMYDGIIYCNDCSQKMNVWSE